MFSSHLRCSFDKGDFQPPVYEILSHLNPNETAANNDRALGIVVIYPQPHLSSPKA